MKITIAELMFIIALTVLATMFIGVLILDFYTVTSITTTEIIELSD